MENSGVDILSFADLSSAGLVRSVQVGQLDEQQRTV